MLVVNYVRSAFRERVRRRHASCIRRWWRARALRRSLQGRPRLDWSHRRGGIELERDLNSWRPQAKPWLIRLEVFQIGVLPGPQRWAVRDEILAVLPEIVNQHGEFTERDLMARLNSDKQVRRRAVEKALTRLAMGRQGHPALVDRASPGLFRLRIWARSQFGF